MKLSEKIRMAFGAGESFLRYAIFRRKKRPAAARQVLLILWDRLGDLILYLPYAKIQAEFYRERGCGVSFLCNAAFMEFVKEVLNPDEVLGFDRKAFFSDSAYGRTFLAKMASKGYAVTVNPRICREFLVDDILTLACGAEERIGVAPGDQAINPVLMKYSDRWYTKLIVPPEPFSVNYHHYVFTRTLTGKTPPMGSAPLFPETLTTRCPVSGEYAVLILGALDPWRIWPLEKVAEVIRRSRRFIGKQLVCIGAESEGCLVLTLKELLPEESGRILDLTGKTALTELPGLFAHSSFVFGNETGTIHLAAYSGARVYCIEGQGHWGRFLPYEKEWIPCEVKAPVCIGISYPCRSCNWHCIYFSKTRQRCPCIDNITPEMLIAAIDSP